MQSHEDRVNEAIMIMKTNSEVLASLRTFYLELVKELSLQWVVECREAISEFASHLNEMIYDLNMHIARGNFLVKISEDRRGLMRNLPLRPFRQLG